MISVLNAGKRSRYLCEKAESLGAKVFVQSANGNEETQMSQIENMINRGVDVLVIIPYNGQVLSNVVKEAKQEGIKVLAYDRMINDADIDFYISFDNEKSVNCRQKPRRYCSAR